MGCRCAERARQIRTAGAALARGDVAAARQQMAQAGRTFVEDVRSGAVTEEARRLAASRLVLRRR